MAIPKVNVSVDLFQLVGTALPLARVRLTLPRPDVVAATGEIVVMGSWTMQGDLNGHATGQFFPNDQGRLGTSYLVEVFDQNGLRVFPADGRQVSALIPNMDVALQACLFMVPPLTLSDAQ